MLDASPFSRQSLSGPGLPGAMDCGLQAWGMRDELNYSAFNLQLWLDASDSSSLLDGSGSPVAPNGELYTWVEKSGYSRNGTQSVATKFPVRKIAILNGKDGVYFDGSNDFLETPVFGGNQTFSRFVVFANHSQSQYKTLLSWASAFETPNPGADAMSINAGKLEWIQNGASSTTKLTAWTSSSPNCSDAEFIIFLQVANGTNSGHVAYRNGKRISAANTYNGNPGNFVKTPTKYGIGAYNNGTAPANVTICEILHFAELLPPEIILGITRKLGSKWGIPVP